MSHKKCEKISLNCNKAIKRVQLSCMEECEAGLHSIYLMSTLWMDCFEFQNRTHILTTHLLQIADTEFITTKLFISTFGQNYFQCSWLNSFVGAIVHF